MVDLAERRLSHVFEALSDPGRRLIVKRLAQSHRAPCTPSDLVKPLHMSLQGVTKHIAVLERAGIVKREKRGRQRILSLDAAPLHAAGAWIEHYRAFWEDKLDALAAHVADSAPNSGSHFGAHSGAHSGQHATTHAPASHSVVNRSTSRPPTQRDTRS